MTKGVIMTVCKVIKRNGSEVDFDGDKISKVLDRVMDESEFEVTDMDKFEIIEGVLAHISELNSPSITTESINDVVERTLMSEGFYDEARAFILYRDRKRKIEGISADNDAMSEYIFTQRYSRHLPKKHRRETWSESVDRVRDMHIRKYPEITKEITWAFEQVRDKRVLPSMRSMQFGGEPIEEKNARLYNCSYSPIDRLEAFSEAMYLLLAGCGVGFSVEFENINKLPELKTPSNSEIVHYTIEDTIEGWADSIKSLIESYVNGVTIEFIYKKIRKRGIKDI